MTTIILFLLVIVFLVVAHELGHFFVAKAFGVRVDEFGIGYPPRAGKLFTWKKTDFTLNWLPFGGFVRIFGEDETTSAESHVGSFAYQKMWKRILILVAGIVANILLAIILYAISFGIGFLGNPEDFPGSVPLGPNEAIVTSVLAASPASAARVQTGDSIVSLSTASGDKDIPTSVDDVIDFIHAHGTDAITLAILRNGKPVSVTLTPKAGVVGQEPGIGVGLAEAAHIRLSFFRAIREGVMYAVQEFGATIVGICVLIGGLFHGNKQLLSEVSGPVGIAQIASQAYLLGIGSLLSFVALISVNLAVINLFPFPALDGGRIILELFTSKGKSKIPQKVVSAVNQVGFLLLILLMLYVTYHDIRHLIA